MKLFLKLLKKLAFALICGILFLWGTFWYISGSPYGLVNFIFIYYTSTHYFYEPVKKEAIFDGILKGMVESLQEPHSIYLTPNEYKQLKDMSKSEYVGVGILLGSKDGRPMIISPIDGSPAAKAGIKGGELILKIDGKDTSNLSLDSISNSIRGKAGTSVRLELQNSDGTVKEVTLERKSIELPTVSGKMLTDHIGYIRISHFAEKTGEEFAKEYEALKAKGMDKLVLDLRYNPGGLVVSAQQVGDYILPKGPIVSIRTRNGQQEVYESRGKTKLLPLVVLVNKGSASASEIIAAAVQDEKVGTIIGTNTYGKGTVQTVISGPSKNAVKLTIAKYHTPADRVIDGKGVKPDIVVADSPNRDNEGKDIQLQKAIEIIREKNTVAP